MAQELEQDVKRVSVNFSKRAYKDLEDLAEEEDTNISEALRRAIALSKWLLQVQKSGGTLLVEQNGKVKEVVKI